MPFLQENPDSLKLYIRLTHFTVCDYWMTKHCDSLTWMDGIIVHVGEAHEEEDVTESVLLCLQVSIAFGMILTSVCHRTGGTAAVPREWSVLCARSFISFLFAILPNGSGVSVTGDSTPEPCSES